MPLSGEILMLQWKDSEQTQQGSRLCASRVMDVIFLAGALWFFYQ